LEKEREGVFILLLEGPVFDTCEGKTRAAALSSLMEFWNGVDVEGVR
jgi:hypothetical protein